MAQKAALCNDEDKNNSPVCMDNIYKSAKLEKKKSIGQWSIK